MDLKEMGEVVGATAAIGGGLLWLFREKMREWVKEQTRERWQRVEARTTKLEKDQANHEGELMRIAESMERTSENMNDAMRRMTTAVERIAESHEETKDAVNYIRGRFDQANGGEFRPGPRA